MQSDKKKVFEAYNMIAGWFVENRSKSLVEKKYLGRLINIRGRNATVLDRQPLSWFRGQTGV